MDDKKGNCSESSSAVDPSSEETVSVLSFENDGVQAHSSELVVMSSNSESISAVDSSTEVAVSVSSFENYSASFELVDMSSNSGCNITGDPSSELIVNSSRSECEAVENPALGIELDILSFEIDSKEWNKIFAEVFGIAYSVFSTRSDSDSIDSDETLSAVDDCSFDLNSTIPDENTLISKEEKGSEVEVDAMERPSIEFRDCSFDLNSIIPDENTLISKEEKGSKVEVDAMERPSIEFRIRGSLVIQAGIYLHDKESNVDENKVKIIIPSFTLGARSEVAESNEDRDSADIVDYAQEITEELIASLLKHFKNNRYDAVSVNGTDKEILTNCLHLYEKDYECEKISNTGGTLSKFYPSEIIIPRKQKNANYEECIKESCASNLKPAKFRNLACSSSPSRCRTRFPVPVMLSDGKFICRAATLSVRKGAVLEQLTQPKERKEMVHDGTTRTNDTIDTIPDSRSNVVSSLTTLVNPNSMNQLKEQDVRLLEYLGVSVISDLMVEDRKIHTGVTVGSSEKVNKDIYEDFQILQMPYPGCEFFRKYNEANRDPTGLKFDWDQRDVTTEFKLPEGFSLSPPATDFTDYKEWDIVTLTKEYLLLQLRVIITSGNNCGFLVHCVCGWDRTPLFITLLRLSLWADGLIHQTLTPVEMAYLAIGYDWYLFGHDLPTRLRDKEEVMHFCFNFISEIASDDFSMTREWHKHKRSEDSKDNRRVPPFNPCEREAKLLQVQKILLDLYKKEIDA
ncbi:myotubularin-related protein 14-like isoform X3 [Stegodyphus dumicola]|uniref:myotubularin-related protein 14-like isoform X3 n=1 Tax=Stegodyphus dumicola TaxID=202533 RepID=UPI0015AF7367|nr:myotubularin-related protein 14-like isoform X3 [Stegodyphus dumicola]